MVDYLLKIKSYVDELASVDVPVRHEEHVDAILEGLSSNYAPLFSGIENKKGTPSIAEIEALMVIGHVSLVLFRRHKL